jgi:hypothetical protein
MVDVGGLARSCAEIIEAEVVDDQSLKIEVRLEAGGRGVCDGICI